MRVQSQVEEIPWRSKWQPSPVFLPGKFHGQRSLVGYSPWSWEELGVTVTEHTHTQNGVCDRGPEAEWLLNCVASGQKGWIPRWENQNAILDALIQNLASTLLPLKKKKKSFTWPQIFGSITNCTKGDTAQVLNQSAPLLLHLWCGGKSDLISLTVVRIPWDEACKILFRVQLLHVC